ncbi:MAG: iron-containing alcohol dehydrogenase [Dehalococcoidia bacterium]|nr:iron-containing alcohol dehydrogenase [Dehalococcoidia bacterium]
MGISRFYLPIRFIIGADSILQLGKESVKAGKKALLVTGSRSMRSTGTFDKAARLLDESGVGWVSYEKIEPNPRAATIDEGASLARQHGVDMVIGLGGGSVMDATKLLALAACGTDKVFSYYENKASNKNALPIILVPTVAASGSEANNGAVFTNWETHEKVVYNHRAIYPRVSIIDPVLTLTLPVKTTAQGGVDIFCHLVEPYIIGSDPTPINDALRESSMKTVVDALPLVLNKPDDLMQRSRISWASTIACSQFAGLGGGSGTMTLHGMEHALSGEYNIAHGDGLAALLIEWMKYTEPARRERFQQLGKNVFGESDGIAATEKWLKRIGMDARLKSLGVKETDFEKLADNAVKTGFWVKLNPVMLDKESIAGIYRKAF